MHQYGKRQWCEQNPDDCRKFHFSPYPDAFAFDQLERDLRTAGRNPIEDRLRHAFRSDLRNLLEILSDRCNRRRETLVAVFVIQSHQRNIFRDPETLGRYMALKREKVHMIKEGIYQGENRRHIAAQFGRLLSYPEEGICRYIEKTTGRN